MEPCKGRSRYIDLQTKQKATSNQPTTTNLQEKKTPSWKTQPQCGSFISSINFTFPRFAPTKMVHFPYVFQGFFGSFFFCSYRRMFPPQPQALGMDSKRLGLRPQRIQPQTFDDGKKNHRQLGGCEFFSTQSERKPRF